MSYSTVGPADLPHPFAAVPDDRFTLLGDVVSAEVVGSTVVLDCGGPRLAVSLLASDVARVRLAPTGDFTVAGHGADADACAATSRACRRASSLASASNGARRAAPSSPRMAASVRHSSPSIAETSAPARAGCAATISGRRCAAKKRYAWRAGFGCARP